MDEPVVFSLPCDVCGTGITFHTDTEKEALHVIDAWLDSQQPAICTTCRAMP